MQEEEYLPYYAVRMVETAKMIAGAELLLLNDGGHPLMWSCPENSGRLYMVF